MYKYLPPRFLSPLKQSVITPSARTRVFLANVLWLAVHIVCMYRRTRIYEIKHVHMKWRTTALSSISGGQILVCTAVVGARRHIKKGQHLSLQFV